MVKLADYIDSIATAQKHASGGEGLGRHVCCMLHKRSESEGGVVLAASPFQGTCPCSCSPQSSHQSQCAAAYHYMNTTPHSSSSSNTTQHVSGVSRSDAEVAQPPLHS